MKKYSAELKEKVVELNLREGRSMSSLEKEYNLSKGCVSNWVKSYSKECQNSIEKQEKMGHYSEMLALKKEVDELRKENLFLKKAAAFFAKEI